MTTFRGLFLLFFMSQISRSANDNASAILVIKRVNGYRNIGTGIRINSYVENCDISKTFLLQLQESLIDD